MASVGENRESAAAASTAGELFPLPVTPLEYYYVCDDRPDYPTVFVVELTFSGRLEREVLAAALRAAVARHPLLSARWDWNDGGRPHWLAGDGEPWLEWIEGDAPPAVAAGQPIDLACQAGLRVWVRRRSDGARMQLQFHHACCDGLASWQFVEELLIVYDAIVGGRPAAELRPLDPLRLRQRDAFGVEGGPSLRDVWRTVRLWTGLVTRQPAVLAAPPRGQPDALPESGYVTEPIPGELLRRLRLRATDASATLNDLVLRDVLLVVDRWNVEHGGTNRRLRINVPTNLRGRGDERLPAANVLSFAFVGASRPGCRSPERLLEAVRRATQRIKRQRSGLYFVGGLAWACGRRGLVPWMLARPRSFATLTLSNLGRLGTFTPLARRDGKLLCGEAVLERVTGAPPVRPLTRASLAVVAYGGETTLNLRCDPAQFDAAGTRALLGRIVARLRESAQ